MIFDGLTKIIVSWVIGSTTHSGRVINIKDKDYEIELEDKTSVSIPMKCCRVVDVIIGIGQTIHPPGDGEEFSYFGRS